MFWGNDEPVITAEDKDNAVDAGNRCIYAFIKQKTCFNERKQIKQQYN